MVFNNIEISVVNCRRRLPVFMLVLVSVIIIFTSASECLGVTLTITANNGSVTVTPDKADYSVGEVVELKPKPDTGYYFSGWSGDAHEKRLVLNLTMESNKSITANFDTWQPPIGIPAPEFGIFETYRMYDNPASRNPALTYTQNTEGGYYTHYVDNTHPEATDSGNSYGTASVPRNTIPLNLIAGSVVEVHGGPYSYSNYGGHLGVVGMGTLIRPIFVRGPISGNKPIFNNLVQVDGEYVILENINSDGSSGSQNGGIRVLAPAHHIAVRGSEVQNRTGGPTTALSASSWTSEWVHDVVFYNNSVHDVGDWQTTVDEDHHAAGPGKLSYRVWILDNEIWHASGDGTQINAGNSELSNLTHHIYVGRNIYFQNKQSGVWVKNAQDVVISQNEIFDFQPSGSSSGQCMGYQYDPQRVWYLFNHVHNASKGLTTGSANIGTREDMYIIGNCIHNVGRGIEINSGGVDSEMIIGNTVYNVDIGIANGYYGASMQMFNNLISDVSSHHIYFPSGYNTADNSSMDFMLFGSPAQIEWGDNTVRDLSNFQSTFGQGSACIEADPQVVDAANDDFRLLSTSLAIDAASASGVVQEVFDRFQGLYGIDIRKDIEGVSRPQGAGWDIGAYEFVPDPSNQAPVANAGPDQAVDDLDRNGSEQVTLDGSGSVDSDGTIQVYAWSEGGTQIATGVSPTVTLAAGEHTITLRVTDDDGTSDTDTVRVTVSISNQAPVLAAIGDRSVAENSTLSFSISATDGDGDSITYSATGLPSGATLSGQTFSWTPGYTQAGTHNVTFTASDGTAQDSEIVAITVNNTNRAPVLASIGSKSVNEGSSLSFSVSASDADGETITYSASPLPTGAAFSGQTFSWTPGYTQAGAYSVTFTAGDGTAQDSEAVTITVNNTNRAPQLAWIGNQAASVGSLLSFSLSATDADNDTVTYSATGLPTGATLSGQTFTWTPATSQEGTYSTTFVASDGTAQDSETVTIAVDDNQAPSIANLSPAADSIQAPLNSLVILHVTDAGMGVDGSTVQITLDGAVVYTGDTADYRSNAGNCRRTGAPADYTYAYQPDEPFDFDQLKAVTVNASDQGGIAMNQQSYSFRTEMRSFGQNKQVSAGLGALGNDRPATVRDGSGNVWAVWHAGPAGGRDIYVGKLAGGGDAFGASVRVTSSSSDEVNPAIAVGSDGRLYVVWQDNRRGNWDIYGSSSTDGTSWVTERRIVDSSDNESFNQVNPALAVDGRSPSHAYVVWQDDRAGNYDIYIAESIDAFATNVITQVTSNTSDQTEPAVAVNSSGTAYVLWTDARNTANGTDIYGAAGSPWTNVAVVSKAANQSDPAIAVESAGDTWILHILWVDRASGNSDIYYGSSTGLPASPLAGSTLIDDTEGKEQVSPAVAVAGTGGSLKVFACWQDHRNVSGGTGDTDIYMVQTNSESGTNVFVGDGGTNSNQTAPVMGVDSSGYPYIVWADSRATNPGIYYAASTYMQSSALASGAVSASTSETIGPSSVTNVDDVSIAIPAGACPYDVTISITRVDNPQEFSLPILNGYEFSPSGLELNAPATITIPFAVSSTAGTPTPYWYNSLTGTLSQQGIDNIEIIELTSTLHALRFTTTHLTPYYALLGAETTSTDSSVSVSGDSGGGGGGGCSLSDSRQGGRAIEYFLPYCVLALVMLVLRLKDRRRERV